MRGYGLHVVERSLAGPKRSGINPLECTVRRDTCSVRDTLLHAMKSAAEPENTLDGAELAVIIGEHDSAAEQSAAEWRSSPATWGGSRAFLHVDWSSGKWCGEHTKVGPGGGIEIAGALEA